MMWLLGNFFSHSFQIFEQNMGPWIDFMFSLDVVSYVASGLTNTSTIILFKYSRLEDWAAPLLRH